MLLRNRYRGALLGLACGDAVGTTVEFEPPGSFAPLTDMIGGGPFNLQPGQWTDDTSMALCLAASLDHCQGFDAGDQMQRYCDWWLHGYMSSTGECFDIGGTVSNALLRFRHSGNPFSGSTRSHSAGNGSLMRLAPVVLFYFPDRNKAVHYSGESSRTTHAAQEAIDSCRIFAQALCIAFDAGSKAEILELTAPPNASERLKGIAAGVYRGRPEAKIRGTGYVVDCLEAALWCFERSENFREAVLLAANLGEDADTTAAVVGQIAGAYYGEGGIPQSWLERLAMRETLETLSDALLRSTG